MLVPEFSSLDMTFEAHVEGTCAEIDLTITTAWNASEHNFRMTIDEADNLCFILAANILEAVGYDITGNSVEEMFQAYLRYRRAAEDAYAKSDSAAEAHEEAQDAQQ